MVTITPRTLRTMQGKHVLITGATGGLGLGVTPAVLATHPAEVTIPYTSEAHLQRLMTRLSPADQQKLRGVTCNLVTTPTAKLRCSRGFSNSQMRVAASQDSHPSILHSQQTLVQASVLPDSIC